MSRGRGKKTNNNLSSLMRPRNQITNTQSNVRVARERLELLISQRQVNKFNHLIQEAKSAEKVGGLAQKGTISVLSYQQAVVDKVAELSSSELLRARDLGVSGLLFGHIHNSGNYEYPEMELWTKEMFYSLKGKRPLDDNHDWWRAFMSQFLQTKHSQDHLGLLHQIDENQNAVMTKIEGFEPWAKTDDKMVNFLLNWLEKEPVIIDHYQNKLMFDLIKHISQADLNRLVEKPQQKVGVLKALLYLPQAQTMDLSGKNLNKFALNLIHHPKLSTNAVAKFLESAHYKTPINPIDRLALIKEFAKRPELFRQKSTIYHATEVLVKSAKKINQNDNNSIINEDNNLSAPSLINQTLISLINLPQWTDRQTTRISRAAELINPSNPAGVIDLLTAHVNDISESRQEKLIALKKKYQKRFV